MKYCTYSGLSKPYSRSSACLVSGSKSQSRSQQLDRIAWKNPEEEKIEGNNEEGCDCRLRRSSQEIRSESHSPHSFGSLGSSGFLAFACDVSYSNGNNHQYHERCKPR